MTRSVVIRLPFYCGPVDEKHLVDGLVANVFVEGSTKLIEGIKVDRSRAEHITLEQRLSDGNEGTGRLHLSIVTRGTLPDTYEWRWSHEGDYLGLQTSSFERAQRA